MGLSRWMKWAVSTSHARCGVVTLLTSRDSWAIPGVDLAIKDIPAYEHHRAADTLGAIQVVTEAPSPRT